MGKGKRRRRNKKWIQGAIKHRGALKTWLKKNRGRVKRSTGSDPFTKKGEVNTNTLRKLRKTRWYGHLSSTTKRRINLAITLERLKKDR